MCTNQGHPHAGLSDGLRGPGGLGVRCGVPASPCSMCTLRVPGLPGCDGSSISFIAAVWQGREEGQSHAWPITSCIRNGLHPGRALCSLITVHSAHQVHQCSVYPTHHISQPSAKMRISALARGLTLVSRPACSRVQFTPISPAARCVGRAGVLMHAGCRSVWPICCSLQC